MDYTVQIEASNGEGTIWQAVHPSEAVTDWDGTAEELATEVAGNQNLVEFRGDETARVRLWVGANADTSSGPVAEYYG